MTTADTSYMAEETVMSATSEETVVTAPEAVAKMAETRALMGSKGTILTPHTPKTEIIISAVSRPTALEVGWDKSGTTDDHCGLVQG